MAPTVPQGIAASARIAGRHRDTAALEMAAIAAPDAARGGTGDRRPDAVINAGRAGNVPAGRLTAVTPIAVADREPGSVIALLAAMEAGPSAGPTSAPGGSLTAAALSGAMGSVIAVPADTGRIGPAAAALAGTSLNGSAGDSQMSGRIGAAAPLEVPGQSAATTGATVVRVTVTGRAGRGARAGRLGTAPVRARAATATVATAGAIVAGVTVTERHRRRRAFRIALPRTRFLAR